jgi:hypothetical protein
MLHQPERIAASAAAAISSSTAMSESGTVHTGAAERGLSGLDVLVTDVLRVLDDSRVEIWVARDDRHRPIVPRISIRSPQLVTRLR